MTSPTGDGSSRLSRLAATALAVADADPEQIEAQARHLGESRRYLAPIAWAAGALVLLVRGIKLLILNWRLSLVQLVPAAWVWLIMWDLRRDALRADLFRDLTVGQVSALILLAIIASIAAFWCNTVFGFAVTQEGRPRIRPAARAARVHLRRIVVSGVCLGLLLALGAIVIPRIDSWPLYALAIGGLYAALLISFVSIPARILGAKKQRRGPKETIGSWTIGGALSAVAMTPGFVLDRIGLILLGIPGLAIPGFVLLSIGTGLFAAGMSSVRAVKLSMKLDTPDTASFER